MSRPSKDDWALALVKETARRSTCCRRQVGCVLLNGRGHVIATGYNGVAAGLPHCNEFNIEAYSYVMPDVEPPPGFKLYPNACEGAESPSGTNLDGCEAIHAEQNALLQCKNVYEIHTCYVSASPCMTCVKLLLNTACERIVFTEQYPHNEAQMLWEKAGREWVFEDASIPF